MVYDPDRPYEPMDDEQRPEDRLDEYDWVCDHCGRGCYLDESNGYCPSCGRREGEDEDDWETTEDDDLDPYDGSRH